MLNLEAGKTTNEIKGLAMVAKEKKDDKPKISREEADGKMDEFFGKLEDELKDIPQSVIEAGAQKMVDFLKGKVSWTEILNISPDKMKQMVELGYMKFQAGRLEEAERYFKVLSILDPKNSYFHSMLGSILQRQNRHGEAVVHYTEAVDLNPHDLVSMVNRGEIYLQHGWLNDAEADFSKAVSLDPKKEDKWANRARLFMGQIAEIKRRRQEVKKKGKKESKDKKGTNKKR